MQGFQCGCKSTSNAINMRFQYGYMQAETLD